MSAMTDNDKDEEPIDSGPSRDEADEDQESADENDVDDDRGSDQDDESDDGDEDSEDEVSEEEDDDDDDDDDVDESGLTKYERLRMERIKRNQERLAQLGLQSKDGDGVLGKKTSHKKKRNRKPQEPVEQREKLSRRTKAKEVDYSGDLNLRMLLDAEKEAKHKEKLAKKKAKGPRKEKSHDERVPLWIYQEFRRIASSRKENLRRAKRHVRESTREVKYWQKEVNFIENKESDKYRRQKQQMQQEQERALLGGKTQQEILSELEARMPELQQIVEQYDATQMSAEEHQRQQLLKVDEWNKKHALDRKMNMIDALETFPKAINDAMSTLNALLWQRSPKDPPPPRRSRRSITEEEEAALKAPPNSTKRAKTDAAAASPDKQTDANWGVLAANLAAAAARETRTQLGLASVTVGQSDPNEEDADNISGLKTKKRRPKDARNVGGWVSPIFSQQLDRTWLERTKPLKRIAAVPSQAMSKGCAMHVFDLDAYVAQAGDVVLFYPSAYKEFLEVHPDSLGTRLRNLLRVPLWMRARRQLGRLKGGTASEDDKRDIWFTEEWILSLTRKKGDNGIRDSIEASLGDYPILCQVIRSHAEFPPDPYSKEKSISKSGKETTISWAQPAVAKIAATTGSGKQKADRPLIRQAVTLKPLTTVLPPQLLSTKQHISPSSSGSGSLDALKLPPNFTVITNPTSAPLEPHLLPFCYAYTTYHSLSLNEPVYVRRAENDECCQDDSRTKRAGKSAFIRGKGRVVGFASAPKVTEPLSHQQWHNPHHNTRGGGSGLLDMHDLNPMTGIEDPLQGMQMEFGDALGDDPFVLGDEGLADFGGLSDDALVWQHQPGQTQLSPQRPHLQSMAASCSLRIEDRCEELKAILNVLLTGEDLEAALSSDASTSSLPLREGRIIVDFLKMIVSGEAEKKAVAVSGSPPASSSLSFMGFIHSTLPIRRGVTVTIDSNRRQSHRTSPWHLVPFQPNEYVRSTIQDGFLASLENSTREKAVMGLEDLIDYHQPYSQLFVTMVTEQMAPGYYCAVPVAMFFDRIFARLKANSTGQCYYTSTDSIITDLTAIAENCMLFNSPDSELVTLCNNMITDCKKMMLDIGKTSGDDLAKPAGAVTTARKRSTLVIPDSLNAPHKEKLCRQWFQRFAPDGGREGNKNAARHWLPQCGDNIVYSRSRHKVFITGHVESLAAIQCQLPGFQAVGEESNMSTEDLDALTMSTWLKGTVMSVRTSFPLSQGGKSKGSFSKISPILAIELQLNYSWCPDTIIVFWRPCVLLSEAANECPTCSLSHDSFLQPDWATLENMEVLRTGESPGDVPGVLTQDATASMTRCFDLLMRRSLVGIHPGLVNVQEALAMAERNVAIHPGSRSLPSFEDFLIPSELGKKQAHTRGVKRPEDHATILRLAESGFMPIWSQEWIQDQIKLENRKDKVVPKHETLMPFPSLCLELIRLRISNGFYRNVLAIINDISEAYVAAVLYLLSGPASRKTNKISIRKIAKYLASPRGNPKMPKLYYKRQSKKSLGGNDVCQPSTKQEVDDLSESFSQEEISLISRIRHIRSFHATAVVFATQTMSAERIFCLRTYPVPPPPELPAINHMEQDRVDYNPEQIQMVSKIRWILQAVGKDQSQNRFPFQHDKQYNLRISCGGQIIGETGDLQALADGLTYFRPSSVLARLPQGQCMRVRMRVGDEFIYGDERPVASGMAGHTAASGWPLPSPGTPAISLLSISHQISLEFGHFEKNDELTRAIFGMPGKRFSCVRCQSKGLSVFHCRVRKSHSNLDFSIIEHFQGTVGVDSLFLPWKSGEKQPETTTKAKQTDDDEDDEQALVNDLEEKSKKAEATREKRVRDARENLFKAREAQRRAEYLRTQAMLLNQLEVKLSPEFIQNYFPVDEEDNHYTLCIHCGTPGNLLLCDGCSNVAHPQCLGMQEVPEGDWFCPKCARERGLSGPIQPPPSTKTAAATASNKSDLILEADNAEMKSPVAANTHFEDINAPSDHANETKPPIVLNKSIDVTTTRAPDPPKKSPPVPEITDKQFEAQETELSAVIEALSSQHPQPTPKPKPKETPVEDPPTEDEAPRGVKAHHMRPSKRRKKQSHGGSADPIEALSANARAFLETIDITTGKDFLVAQSTQMGNDLIKWRKKQKMPPLKGGGHIATISGWKAIVRNAGGVEYLDDDPDEFAEVMPQSKQRSRASIEKCSANVMASPKAKKQQARKKTDKQKVPRSDNPIENLPAQGQNFCKYLLIVDAEDFLSQRTADLAEELINYRRKEKLPVLAGSGPSAYVAQWKSQLRREVAYQRSKEEQRGTNRRKVKRGSKVHDVEEAPEAKKLRLGRQNSCGSAKSSSKQKKGDDDTSRDISFNVLEETQKLAAEEEGTEARPKEPHEWNVATSGRRQRLKTNRYTPPTY